MTNKSKMVRDARYSSLRKTHKKLVTLWAMVLFFALLNLVLTFGFIIQKNKLIALITKSDEINVKMIKLSKKVDAVPFLLEKYVFTLYSWYLQIYWQQLELDFTVDNLIYELSKFNEFKREVEDINKADKELREEEVLALKLMFSAYHIPQEVINDKIKAYQLSEQQQMLSDADKLQQSHDILFDINRQKKLDMIQNSIETLRKKISQKYDHKIKTVKETIGWLEMLLIISSVLLILCVISIVWLRLINKLIVLRSRAFMPSPNSKK
ncbi:hypothetical protein [Legionella oakridgensis]|uniref:Chemotaxis methyl-accepting receptor HlyB-like 4HB MCP domain-containing protein n=2 Tax=Legionella oakridgensis TaxID=29423 RepID=W0BGH9_9GAMM|nr:hypothetical protein [Legionella oakridgensis]AHE67727.1 hypothetical protein Loa_02185 [Legionella oakridgensis ATCC 33761 = DSM 21215]ETO92691.1 hypothetical protein LOR_40c04750 [Legionella oakridgensis RV-2-2007]KTD36942.1 hypothetical protein Loak_2078 [Legionella oakridgensis]STY20749.1 Uncharacterised protein [Legionella longbeachae]